MTLPVNRRGPRIRLSVTTRILLVFLALSVGAILVTGFVATLQIRDISTYAIDRSGDLGVRAMDDSTAALERDAQSALLRLARDQAYISNIIFEQVEGETTMMANFAQETMDNPSRVRQRHFYLQDDEPANRNSTSVLFLSPGV